MPLPVLSRQPREVLRIAGTPIPQRAAVDEALDLRHHLDVLRAHRWLIVSVAVLCLLAAALYALVARPVYEANMLFHVEEVSPNASRNILNDVSSLFDTKKEAVAEMELLRSRAVIEPAVLRLRLDLDAAPNYLPLLERWLGNWPGPPLLPPGVFGYGGYGWGGERIVVGEFAVPEPLLGHGFTLTARAGDGYDLSSEEDGIAATGRVGWPLSVATPNGALVLTVQRLQALPGTRFRLMRITPQAAVERVQRAMTVSEQGRQSGVISVRLRGDAPQLSRDTLSEIGREYLRQNRARKVEEAERSLAFLTASCRNCASGWSSRKTSTAASAPRTAPSTWRRKRASACSAWPPRSSAAPIWNRNAPSCWRATPVSIRSCRAWRRNCAAWTARSPKRRAASKACRRWNRTRHAWRARSRSTRSCTRRCPTRRSSCGWCRPGRSAMYGWWMRRWRRTSRCGPTGR
jgi:hypothetical protein